MKEMNAVRAAIKKATILNSDGELDIKRMKQSFFQEFYLMSGLASLRNLTVNQAALSFAGSNPAPPTLTH